MTSACGTPGQGWSTTTTVKASHCPAIAAASSLPASTSASIQRLCPLTPITTSGPSASATSVSTLARVPPTRSRSVATPSATRRTALSASASTSTAAGTPCRSNVKSPGVIRSQTVAGPSHANAGAQASRPASMSTSMGKPVLFNKKRLRLREKRAPAPRTPCCGSTHRKLQQQHAAQADDRDRRLHHRPGGERLLHGQVEELLEHPERRVVDVRTEHAARAHR